MTTSRKPKAIFLCQECGHSSPRWEGRCSACGAWNSYEEVAAPARGPRTRAAGLVPPTSQPLELDRQPSDGEQRLALAMPEVDRLLGGGVVRGSVLLLAGEPGIGKSTLLLQLASQLAGAGRRVLYVSGEESGGQVRLRAERLGVASSGVLFLAETQIEQVLAQLEATAPEAVVVDSIQALYSEEAPSSAGSVVQVRECAQLLMRWAKKAGAPVFLAGHVTKDGSIAGPRVLEHMVDVVLYLEGEPLSSYRLVHGVKNRFGATNDVALLEMRGDGLAEVADPSAAFIGERQEGVSGSAIVVTLEGSRPLLAEVQALTHPSIFNPPRRTCNGIDFNRMVMVTAVLGRRAGVALAGQDVMVNVAGGLRVSEPAADLAVAMAIASSFHDRPLDPATVFVGEVGLNGEVRRVPQVDRRLAEAARHGFRRALAPPGSAQEPGATPAMEVVPVRSLREALERTIGHRGKQAAPKQ